MHYCHIFYVYKEAKLLNYQYILNTRKLNLCICFILTRAIKNVKKGKKPQNNSYLFVGANINPDVALTCVGYTQGVVTSGDLVEGVVTSQGHSDGTVGQACRFCGVQFVTKIEKLKHELEEHKAHEMLVASCQVCGKSFRSAWGYKCHIKTHEISHGNTDNCVECYFCKKYFQSPSHLRRHMRSHSSERPYICKKCGRSYKHNFALIKHSCPSIME